MAVVGGWDEGRITGGDDMERGLFVTRYESALVRCAKLPC